MLKKKFRLPSYITLSHSSYSPSPFFTVKIGKNTLAHNRYGFVVSKKIDKRAVVRNRIKRQLRSCIEALQKDLSSGYDMLFIIKKTAILQSTRDLYASVVRSLASHQIIKNT